MKSFLIGVLCAAGLAACQKSRAVAPVIPPEPVQPASTEEQPDDQTGSVPCQPVWKVRALEEQASGVELEPNGVIWLSSGARLLTLQGVDGPLQQTLFDLTQYFEEGYADGIDTIDVNAFSVSDGMLYVATDYQVFASRDRGRTFVRLAAPTYDPDVPSPVEDVLSAGGEVFFIENNGKLHAAQAGGEFHVDEALSKLYYWAFLRVFSLGSEHRYVLDAGGRLLGSSDGGKNWQLRSGDLGAVVFSDVALGPKGLLMANVRNTRDDAQFRTVWSPDGGAHFSVLSEQGLGDFAHLGGSAWLSTRGAAFVRTTDHGRSWSEEEVATTDEMSARLMASRVFSWTEMETEGDGAVALGGLDPSQAHLVSADEFADFSGSLLAERKCK